jgi:hypothetical protein
MKELSEKIQELKESISIIQAVNTAKGIIAEWEKENLKLQAENAALKDKASRFDELMNKMIEGYDKQVEKLEQQLAEAQTTAEKYRTLYFNTLNRYEYFKYHKPDVLGWEGKEGEG